MKPGLTAFTRILRGSNSEAMTWVKANSAALEPESTLIAGVPPWSATELVKTIDPPSGISRDRRWAVKNAPFAQQDLVPEPAGERHGLVNQFLELVHAGRVTLIGHLPVEDALHQLVLGGEMEVQRPRVT
jgi:hypothetical protein